VSIRIKSDKRNEHTFVTIDKMPRATSRAIRGSLYEIGSESVKHMRNMVRTGERTGRLYGDHRASAPGEPPAARPNSRLTKGMRYTVRGDFQCEFGATAPYAVYLEDGTRNMHPRPYVIRTVKEKQRDVRDIFRKNLNPKRMLK